MFKNINKEKAWRLLVLIITLIAIIMAWIENDQLKEENDKLEKKIIVQKIELDSDVATKKLKEKEEELRIVLDKSKMEADISSAVEAYYKTKKGESTEKKIILLKHYLTKEALAKYEPSITQNETAKAQFDSGIRVKKIFQKQGSKNDVEVLLYSEYLTNNQGTEEKTPMIFGGEFIYDKEAQLWKLNKITFEKFCTDVFDMTIV
ncbi:MAG: hypothetical protein ACRCUS_02390 [Anaerovoracaceae bacterium]